MVIRSWHGVDITSIYRGLTRGNCYLLFIDFYIRSTPTFFRSFELVHDTIVLNYVIRALRISPKSCAELGQHRDRVPFLKRSYTAIQKGLTNCNNELLFLYCMDESEHILTRINVLYQMLRIGNRYHSVKLFLVVPHSNAKLRSTLQTYQQVLERQD